jgi:transglutaminase-like putative cysteine protease
MSRASMNGVKRGNGDPEHGWAAARANPIVGGLRQNRTMFFSSTFQRRNSIFLSQQISSSNPISAKLTGPKTRGPYTHARYEILLINT